MAKSDKTNTKLKTPVTSRGVNSILRRYKGIDINTVKNKATQNINGECLKCCRIGRSSNRARNRFCSAKRACKKGRYRVTIASDMAPRKPLTAAGPGRSARVPPISNNTGIDSHIRLPKKPRNPTQKKYGNRKETTKSNTASRSRNLNFSN